MQKNKISRYFIFLGLFTFLAIFVFIVQQSYNNLIRPTTEVQNSSLIKSVDPKLDIDTLNLIEQKKEFSPWKRKVFPLLSD